MKKRKRATTWIGVGLLLAAAVFAAQPGQTDIQQTDTVTEQSDVTSQDESGRQLDTFSTMEVHFIDVGQGDATLIMCDGDAMLIDAGDNSKGTLIQNYLQKRGVDELDYLVLTHPDSDHIGGAAVVVSKFDIGMVFMSDYEKDNKTYKNLLQALEDKTLTWSTPEVGATYQLGSAEFTILAPNDTYSDPNDASIALLLENGEDSFLFTGDAEEKAEMDILKNGLSIQADVYQVGHHGSKTSSCPDFLDAVMPNAAVISCGEGNSYGHPNAQTMNSFRERGILVYRTDEQGSIVATSDGSGVISWNCAPSDTWKAGEPTGGAAK